MLHMIPLTSHLTYSYAPTFLLKKGGGRGEGKGFILASQNTRLQSSEPIIISKETHIARAICAENFIYLYIYLFTSC